PHGQGGVGWRSAERLPRPRGRQPAQERGRRQVREATMLNAVIRSALRYRALVIAVGLLVLVYGGYLTTTLAIDVFPDLDRPRVVILTECPGLSSEEVETLITYPIETALLGASGVEAVRSQSSQGM